MYSPVIRARASLWSFITRSPKDLLCIFNQAFITGTAPLSIMSIGRYFISDAVLRDHRQIEELYNSILETTDTDERSRRTKNLADEVIRHCHAEEVILHPVFETQGHHGKTILKRDRATYEKVGHPRHPPDPDSAGLRAWHMHAHVCHPSLALSDPQ